MSEAGCFTRLPGQHREVEIAAGEIIRLFGQLWQVNLD
jgi:hypothetical protein